MKLFAERRVCSPNTCACYYWVCEEWWLNAVPTSSEVIAAQVACVAPKLLSLNDCAPADVVRVRGIESSVSLPIRQVAWSPKLCAMVQQHLVRVS